MGVLVTIIFTTIGVMAITDTNDNINTMNILNNELQQTTKEHIIEEINIKVDHMTTYEADRWLKENGWYYEYGEYSRQYKIDKIKELQISKL